MSRDVDRMGVTPSPSLLSELDDMVVADECDSRSEAARDAFHVFATEFNQQTRLSGSFNGTVVILYEHDHSDVSDKMIELQHDFTEIVIAVHHVHLGDHLCLESIAVDGTGERIEELPSRIRLLKGVHQVRLAAIEADR